MLGTVQSTPYPGTLRTRYIFEGHLHNAQVSLSQSYSRTLDDSFTSIHSPLDPIGRGILMQQACVTMRFWFNSPRKATKLFISTIILPSPS